MFNVVICLVSLYPPLKFHKNLVFAFSMRFEVNFQVKTEGEVLQVTLALVLVE